MKREPDRSSSYRELKKKSLFLFLHEVEDNTHGAYRKLTTQPSPRRSSFVVFSIRLSRSQPSFPTQPNPTLLTLRSPSRPSTLSTLMHKTCLSIYSSLPRSHQSFVRSLSLSLSLSSILSCSLVTHVTPRLLMSRLSLYPPNSSTHNLKRQRNEMKRKGDASNQTRHDLFALSFRSFLFREFRSLFFRSIKG